MEYSVFAAFLCVEWQNVTVAICQECQGKQDDLRKDTFG
jgi:hypothetical protein